VFIFLKESLKDLELMDQDENMWSYKLGKNFTAKHANIKFYFTHRKHKVRKAESIQSFANFVFFLNKPLDKILACFALKLFTNPN
jgi:hypothetical protein